MLSRDEWLQTVKRLQSPLTPMVPTVRQDVATALQVALAQATHLGNALAEIEGLRKTMVFLSKKLGPIEIAHDEIAGLTPNDSMTVSDVEVEPGKWVKRFIYSDEPPPPPAEEPKIVAVGPRLVQ